jgi:hypothetical protein
MVFDAHERAFRFSGGACRRGIYDGMRTAVDALFAGRQRTSNRRFAQLCSHHLVEPTACTPGAGWEKGQVENQVRTARGRFLTPVPRFQSLAELNAWLEERCLAWAKSNAHPTRKERTVWEVFEADERPALIPYAGPFDGFREVDVVVSRSSLFRHDHNRYSAAARAACRGVRLGAYADRIVVFVGEHPRCFGRDRGELRAGPRGAGALLQHGRPRQPARGRGARRQGGPAGDAAVARGPRLAQASTRPRSSMATGSRGRRAAPTGASRVPAPRGRAIGFFPWLTRRPRPGPAPRGEPGPT